MAGREGSSSKARIELEEDERAESASIRSEEQRVRNQRARKEREGLTESKPDKLKHKNLLTSHETRDGFYDGIG